MKKEMKVQGRAASKKKIFDRIVDRMQAVLREEAHEVERFNGQLRAGYVLNAIGSYSEDLIKAAAAADMVRSIALLYLDKETITLERCVRTHYDIITDRLLTGSFQYDGMSSSPTSNAVALLTRQSHIRMRGTLKFWLDLFEEAREVYNEQE